MRKFVTILLIAILFISGCQKELNTELPDSKNLNDQSFLADLQGNIYDENDQPAAGVKIIVGSKNTTTNANGYFKISNASLNNNASLITAEKAGYFKSYRSFRATSGTNQVLIKLIKKVSAGTVNAVTGGEVSLSNGSKIALQSNSVVVSSSGIAYSGSVNVYARYIDPTMQDITQTIPGSFMADDKDRKRVVLESFGMLAVELESAAGEKLQIAQGKTATLTTAIPSSLRLSAPASISLWYIDEQTGIWKEEGTANKNGNNYVGEVNHFTFWNCDRGVPSVIITLNLKNTDQLPVANAVIYARTTAANAPLTGYSWTDSQGRLSELVPANEVIDLSLIDPCHQVVHSIRIGPFSKNTDLGTIYTPQGISIVTIKGKLSGCSGEKLVNTVAVISINNMVHSERTDANGNFVTNFIQCAGAQNTVEIFGVDATAMQQGNTFSMSTTLPVTNTGNIIACGNALQQYISYNLDGGNYLILDSLDAYTNNNGSNSNTTFIFGKGILSPDQINFNFQNAFGPGTYPIAPSIRDYHSISTNQPTVTITSFPQNAGQFYEGTISVQFSDYAQNLQHSLNGTFRVRRRF